MTPVELLTVQPVLGEPTFVTAYVIAPPFDAGVVTEARAEGVTVEDDMFS